MPTANNGTPDPPLAVEVAAARRRLEERMRAAGLRTSEGWQVMERVIEITDGLTWFLTAAHPSESPPEGMSESVAIDRAGHLLPD